MYAAFWRALPGPWPLKALQTVVLAGVLVVVLFTLVFPWLEPRLPFNDSTVDSTEPTSGTATPGPQGSAGLPGPPAPSPSLGG